MQNEFCLRREVFCAIFALGGEGCVSESCFPQCPLILQQRHQFLCGPHIKCCLMHHRAPLGYFCLQKLLPLQKASQKIHTLCCPGQAMLFLFFLLWYASLRRQKQFGLIELALCGQERVHSTRNFGKCSCPGGIWVCAGVEQQVLDVEQFPKGVSQDKEPCCETWPASSTEWLRWRPRVGNSAFCHSVTKKVYILSLCLFGYCRRYCRLSWRYCRVLLLGRSQCWSQGSLRQFSLCGCTKVWILGQGRSPTA